MKGEVFLDTAYAIALASPNDLFHQRAVELADKSRSSRFLNTSVNEPGCCIVIDPIRNGALPIASPSSSWKTAEWPRR